MKLRLEEFKRTEEKPAMQLFLDGIRADPTRDYYTRRLRYLLCGVFEEIFSGSLEERAQERSRELLQVPACFIQSTTIPKKNRSGYFRCGYIQTKMI